MSQKIKSEERKKYNQLIERVRKAGSDVLFEDVKVGL